MDILYTTDNGYALQTAVSMLSLFDHNRDADAIRVFIVEDHMTDENKNRFHQIAAEYGREVRFVALDDILNPEMPIDALSWARVVYGSIFACNIPDLHRAIYLEGDTLVNGSLQALWEMDLGETALGAGLVGKASSWLACAVKDIMTLEIPGRWVYVNVLLMDFDRFRAFQMPQKTIDLLARHGGRINLTNEAVINCFCRDLIAPMPRRFNVAAELAVVPNSAYRIRQMLGLPKDALPIPPVVFHFYVTFCLKPWHVGCIHPARAQWEAYALKTPWALHFVKPQGLFPGDIRNHLDLRFFLRLSHRKDGRLSLPMFCLFLATKKMRHWIETKGS
ncbi:MAG: hypothetical protein LBN04_03200 [Oscillospiraceae bacterium]|jgi:lipopolysaccharide biosynthesis glycosyltransferase|nr:hypothetical protein [Oscillospiraceae bacterium]